MSLASRQDIATETETCAAEMRRPGRERQDSANDEVSTVIKSGHLGVTPSDISRAVTPEPCLDNMASRVENKQPHLWSQDLDDLKVDAMGTRISHVDEI